MESVGWTQVGKPRSVARLDLTSDGMYPTPTPTQRGLVSDPSAVATDPRGLRKTVQENFALTERDESFEYAYGAGEVRGG